jgi:hypothetical protein
MKRLKFAGPLCSITSGSPILAKPSQAKEPPETSVSLRTISIDHSIAIDPIKYIGIPFSFHYFKPHGNIVDNDRMPSEPSSPRRSVFGAYFHFMILALVRGQSAPCLGLTMGWISVVPTFRYCAANTSSPPPPPWHFGEGCCRTAMGSSFGGARSAIECEPQRYGSLHCATVSVVPWHNNLMLPQAPRLLHRKTTRRGTSPPRASSQRGEPRVHSIAVFRQESSNGPAMNVS